jgi:hypothetical protein
MRTDNTLPLNYVHMVTLVEGVYSDLMPPTVRRCFRGEDEISGILLVVYLGGSTKFSPAGTPLSANLISPSPRKQKH